MESLTASQIAARSHRLGFLWLASVAVRDRKVAVERGHRDMYSNLIPELIHTGPSANQFDVEAFNIGVELAVESGLRAMVDVFDVVEHDHGPNAAAWLERRWDGIDTACGATWYS